MLNGVTTATTLATILFAQLTQAEDLFTPGWRNDPFTAHISASISSADTIFVKGRQGSKFYAASTRPLSYRIYNDDIDAPELEVQIELTYSNPITCTTPETDLVSRIEFHYPADIILAPLGTYLYDTEHVDPEASLVNYHRIDDFWVKSVHQFSIRPNPHWGGYSSKADGVIDIQFRGYDGNIDYSSGYVWVNEVSIDTKILMPLPYQIEPNKSSEEPHSRGTIANNFVQSVEASGETVSDCSDLDFDSLSPDASPSDSSQSDTDTSVDDLPVSDTPVDDLPVSDTSVDDLPVSDNPNSDNNHEREKSSGGSLGLGHLASLILMLLLSTKLNIDARKK